MGRGWVGGGGEGQVPWIGCRVDPHGLEPGRRSVIGSNRAGTCSAEIAKMADHGPGWGSWMSGRGCVRAESLGIEVDKRKSAPSWLNGAMTMQAVVLDSCRVDGR